MSSEPQRIYYSDGEDRRPRASTAAVRQHEVQGLPAMMAGNDEERKKDGEMP